MHNLQPMGIRGQSIGELDQILRSGGFEEMPDRGCQLCGEPALVRCHSCSLLICADGAVRNVACPVCEEPWVQEVPRVSGGALLSPSAGKP